MNKTQSGSEEYIPGDYQSDDYQSDDYYYYGESSKTLEFVNFTKCCPEDQVSFCHIHFFCFFFNNLMLTFHLNNVKVSLKNIIWL